jgi:putative endonuclease
MKGGGRKTARRRAEARGRRAEWIAMLWLRLRGYRILAHRVRTRFGELDLVARRGRILAFIEVKQRADPRAAAFALGPRQRGRLVRAAAVWRARNPRHARLQPRFDLVILSPGRWPAHHRGAWRPEGREAADLS